MLMDFTVPPPGARITSSAWVNEYQRQGKDPDKVDPSIFADADEDSTPRIDFQHPLRVLSDVSSILRIPSNDSAALGDSSGQIASNIFAALGTVSHIGDGATRSQYSIASQRTSTIEYLQNAGLLQSASVTTDKLISESLQEADPTLRQKNRSETTPKIENEEDMKEIEEKDIKDWDVLSGRGGKSNHHPGNKRFRQVVEEMKSKYRVTDAKTDKTALSKAIVAYVEGYGGRFLTKSGPGKYRKMSLSECRKKTSQALRETKELKWKL